MAAPVMRDDAVTLAQKKQHLVIPVVRTKRPAVMEHDGLSIPYAPVLVEDASAVLSRKHSHGQLSLDGVVIAVYRQPTLSYSRVKRHALACARIPSSRRCPRHWRGNTVYAGRARDV